MSLAWVVLPLSLPWNIGCTNEETSVSGAFGFTPSSAIVQNWYPGKSAWGDPQTASVLLSNATREEACRATAPPQLPSPAVTMSAIFLELNANGPLTNGRLPIRALPFVFGPGDGEAAYMSRADIYPDGGSYAYEVNPTGSATLSAVTEPTFFSDGGINSLYGVAFTGGELVGSFTVTFTLGGGTTSTLSASFDAKGCNEG